MTKLTSSKLQVVGSGTATACKDVTEKNTSTVVGGGAWLRKPVVVVKSSKRSCEGSDLSENRLVGPKKLTLKYPTECPTPFTNKFDVGAGFDALENRIVKRSAWLPPGWLLLFDTRT
jgi:hypothetical protein